MDLIEEKKKLCRLKSTSSVRSESKLTESYVSLSEVTEFQNKSSKCNLNYTAMMFRC